MKKIFIILIAVALVGVILTAGCVSESGNGTSTTSSDDKYLKVDSKLFEKTGDADKDVFLGNYIAVDDISGRITGLSGQRVYISLYNDGTGKEYDFTYVDGLDFLSETDITWEPIPEGTPSSQVKVTKPASFADDTIYTLVDPSEYDLVINYKWAGETFQEYYRWDATQTNVLRNHDDKQFRKMNDTESIPALD